MSQSKIIFSNYFPWVNPWVDRTLVSLSSVDMLNIKLKSKPIEINENQLKPTKTNWNQRKPIETSENI